MASSSKVIRPNTTKEDKHINLIYHGVSKIPGGYLAKAREPVSQKLITLGTFDTALEAALAYDAAVRRFGGYLAITNFPEIFGVESAKSSCPPSLFNLHHKLYTFMAPAQTSLYPAAVFHAKAAELGWPPCQTAGHIVEDPSSSSTMHSHPVHLKRKRSDLDLNLSL